MTNRFLRAVAMSTLLAFSAMPLACGADDDDATTGDEQNASETTGSFETFVGEDGQHYFHLLAQNGELILRSEGYTSLSGAKNGMKSVRKNGVNAKSYQLLEADNGEFYFNLRAGNNQIIATGETYATKSGAQTGIDTVVRALKNPKSAAAEISGPRFETFEGKNGDHYFRLRAGNGQIILASQGYASKSGAQQGIESVQANGINAAQYRIAAGPDGVQHTFSLVAGNGQTIGRGEMYASKYNANTGATRVREILREMVAVPAATDAEIQAEIEAAANGLVYMSEADYPYNFVASSAPLSGEVTEAAVRELLGHYTDNDIDADSPMSELFGMQESWEDWRSDNFSCNEPDDEWFMDQCNKLRSMEQVLDANLTDIQVFYFGSVGGENWVDGVGVSVFIVGRAPSGNLVGVRTLAIWT